MRANIDGSSFGNPGNGECSAIFRGSMNQFLGCGYMGLGVTPNYMTEFKATYWLYNTQYRKAGIGCGLKRITGQL